MEKIERNGATPIFKQVRDLLHRQISQGLYRPKQAIPDERSLAKQLKLSRMTVRRAILQLTREGLLVRVRGKGTFVRGAKCSATRRATLPLVGLISDHGMVNDNSVFRHRLVAGIQVASELAGFALAFRKIYTPYETFVANLKTEALFQGFILLQTADAPLLRLFENVRVPVVLADSVQPDEAAPSFDEVNHDGGPAVTSALNHLIRLGHRDIVLLVSDSRNWLHRQRRQAYEAALQASGIPIKPELIFEFSPSGERAYAITRTLLKAAQPPTALIAAGGEELALGAMAAISAHGLNIPRDFSIVAYGDTLNFSLPPISTVRVPWEQIGATAIGLLQDRVRDRAAPLKRVRLACEFMQRGSCDVPRLMVSGKA